MYDPNLPVLHSFYFSSRSTLLRGVDLVDRDRSILDRDPGHREDALGVVELSVLYDRSPVTRCVAKIAVQQLGLQRRPVAWVSFAVPA